MMTSSEVRNAFLNFFQARGHAIVPSAPIVVKNDPTLMFTNAGMNQFKDYFLGNKPAPNSRIADTQKCLRVSGKHNDLEEVGVDTYHHTMFEMLGNWSFGDYFKEEAIAWAWELMTDIYKLDQSRLYVTVFGGDEADGLSADVEAENLWKKHIDPSRIIRCSKKDNFWEMGDTGPCGSCSEIHMDLRSDEDRAKVDGKSLVNADDPQVIELWNLVFMEFNRMSDGSLKELPAKHVDTGMGLERVVRAIALQSSNYDTDLFQSTISKLEELCGLPYGKDEKTDIAFRVIADHIRALAFCIADGQLPSNTGAGYVIRRILRRAVRYGYSFLNLSEPFLHQLIAGLANRFAEVFPELNQQADFVGNVVQQEESTFLRTLNIGLDKLGKLFESEEVREIGGATAFELYDTFGFPIDLTMLIASERCATVDLKGFEAELQKQKDRSRSDAVKSTGDWVIMKADDVQEFIGYDHLNADVVITRYREMEAKGKTTIQAVFNLTPFYGESGGQVGDTGTLTGEDGTEIHVVDTQKENDLIIHLLNKLPENTGQKFHATVNRERRMSIARNHSATHLMHSALREVLGDHVAQKGSLVDDKKLRFDCSHFQKPNEEELMRIEHRVNQKIREGIELWEDRSMPYDQAIAKGVTALFGEKYGDLVRVVVFDETYSMELCGGTHVSNTAHIGGFKFTAESSVAAGVRRVEAITGEAYEAYINSRFQLLDTISEKLGHPQDILKQLDHILTSNKNMEHQLEVMNQMQMDAEVNRLKGQIKEVNGVNCIVGQAEVADAGLLKTLAFRLKDEVPNLAAVVAANFSGTPSIAVMFSDDVWKANNWNAGQLVREWGKAIKGGGGGQPFFAQAGGKDASGIEEVLRMAEELLTKEG